MESTKIIFKNAIKENEASHTLPKIIKDISFDLGRQNIRNFSNEAHIQSRLKELFELFVTLLENEGLSSPKTISSVIEGLIKAVSYDKEQYLFKSIYEKEQIEKSIQQQSIDIKQLVVKTYSTIESVAINLDKNEQKAVAEGLNDAKLLSVEMLGLLREAALESFITAIENGTDVKDTIKELAKTFTYQAVNEGKFTKQRALNIASAVIEAASDIADNDHANAPDVLEGAVEGSKEGVKKAALRFKNELKYAPDEIKELQEEYFEEGKKEIISTEESFIVMLKERQLRHEGISAKILAEIIAEYSTYLAKLKRLSADAAEALSDKIENFKGEGLKDFKERAGKSFEKIKKGTSEKVTAFKTDAAPKAKQITDDAKKLGLRAWEATKNAMDDVVKTAKKKGKK